MKGRPNALYEDVAGKMARLIGHGTYRAGDRIPSIRDFSRSMKVSISTALEAYRLLETRGLVEARPQSGYYVSPPRLTPVTEPKLSRTDLKPAEASLTEIAQVIVGDASNPDFFNLGMATPSADVLPAKKLSRILASVVRTKETASVSYLFSDGYEPLRKQIAQRAILAGCPLTPDEIIVTTGCHEAIALSLRALCRPGDAVAIESPFFFNHLQAHGGHGLKIVEIPSSPKEGISLEALGFALEKTRVKACLVSANYSNPTGSCMPDHRKKALVSMLAEKQLPLIEDDIYGDLSFSGARPRAARSFDQEGLVILCSSFSKTLAPGYRVGWVAPGRFHQAIRYQRTINTLAPASPTQMAVAEFLASGGYERHLRRVRRVYEKQLGQMLQALRRHFPEGTRTTRPEGSFIFWVELPEDVDSLELFRRAREKRISIAPGPIFSNSGKYRNFLRLNAAHWNPKVERALETLGSLAREQIA